MATMEKLFVWCRKDVSCAGWQRRRNETLLRTYSFSVQYFLHRRSDKKSDLFATDAMKRRF